MKRRSFLGLGAAAALALSGKGLGAARAQPSEGLHFLTARQYATLAAIAEVVNPAYGAFPSAGELDVAGKLDALLDRMEPGIAAELAQGLDLVGGGFLGLVLAGRTERFASLPLARRQEEWKAWSTSRMALRRSVHKAFTSLCGATYWACPETWPGVGYPGPPL